MALHLYMKKAPAGGKAKVLRIENWFTLESQNSNLSFLCWHLHIVLWYNYIFVQTYILLYLCVMITTIQSKQKIMRREILRKNITPEKRKSRRKPDPKWVNVGCCLNNLKIFREKSWILQELRYSTMTQLDLTQLTKGRWPSFHKYAYNIPCFQSPQRC